MKRNVRAMNQIAARNKHQQDRIAHTSRKIKQVNEIEPRRPEAASLAVKGMDSVMRLLAFPSRVSIVVVSPFATLRGWRQEV